MDNTPRYVLEMQIFKIYLKQNKKTNSKSDNENKTETKSETETETETEQRSKCDCDRAKRERSILYHDEATCDLARASDLAMQSLFCRPTSGRIVATCPETHTECESERDARHTLTELDDVWADADEVEGFRWKPKQKAVESSAKCAQLIEMESK